MTIVWCRGCGMEDTRMHAACPTCGSALQSSSVEWLNDGQEADETVYELEIDSNERSAIVEALIGESISHRWEGTSDLVVTEANEPAVDRILDDVLHDELEFVEGEEGNQAGEDEEDEEDWAGDDGNDGYEMLSRLYLATDNLLKRWEDEDVVNFVSEAGAALVTPTPFGVDEEVWAEIQSHARNAATALEIDKEAEVEPTLKDLHAKLQELV